MCKQIDIFIVFDLLEIDNIIGYLPGNAEVDHPVHEVEGEEHDGEDDPAVLVDITGAHAEYPCWWLSWCWRKGREEGGVASAPLVPIRLVIPREGVLTIVHGAGQQAAGVEPHTGLQFNLVRNVLQRILTTLEILISF